MGRRIIESANIPVHSAAGNRIGTVNIRSDAEPGDPYKYMATYHGKGMKRTSVGWHSTVGLAASAIQNHHETQKKSYQHAADLHRKDYEYHQKIRDSMEESTRPRLKSLLQTIKEAISPATHKAEYHRHMDEYEGWNYEGLNSHEHDYDHQDHCYAKADDHLEKANYHAQKHFELTGTKIRQRDRVLRKKSNPAHVSEAKAPKTKNARIQAWHWMGAKKAMGAKYGFDHNLAVSEIPTTGEHNGKKVNPRRSTIWVAQQFANKDKAKKVNESVSAISSIRSLGYETARRLHGGMGGMSHQDTMAAVKKVKLRVTPGSEEEKAFHAGAEHYCSKNCYKEPNVAEGILDFLKKKKVEPAKKDTWPSIEKNPKAWSRSQHQDREDQAKAAENRRKGLDNNGKSIYGKR